MNAPDQAEQELRRLNDAAFDGPGVDLTQIDMMLALTPEQRLAVLYETATSLARLMVHADARDKDIAVLPSLRATLARTNTPR